MSTLHTAIRSYILGCEYNSSIWQDDPSALITAIQSALSGITNFSYSRMYLSCVKSASANKLEIEIDGITYNSKIKLNSTENDSLIFDLQTALDGISNFTYTAVNITNDRFREDPTVGWPGKSMQEE
jgi:hypothetical protein